MSAPEAPITVWCLMGDQFGHVKPVEEYLGPAATFLYDGEWDAGAMLRAAPDVALCVNEFHVGVTHCLLAAQQAGIPTLTVQDGILEWRCQYENPLFGSGGGSPQHQPVFADKIACIGRQSARQIERWGNPHRCEVVGMPRLDYLLARPQEGRVRGRTKRLLVMTAKKAGFTPDQVEITVRALQDIQAYFRPLGDVELWWRVSHQCESRLEISNRMHQPESAELAAVLREVDAVITTPSTAMLEAMLLHRPVAVLDYHNVPRFVPSAWSISAPGHIPAVVEELLDPPARKLAYQEDCLHDALECASPAAPRLAELLRIMACAGRLAREAGTRFSLPARLVPIDGASTWAAPSPGDLYPEADVFRERDPTHLQVRLARAESENARLRKRLRNQSLSVTMAAAVKARLRR
jgi:hypothetical protein